MISYTSGREIRFNASPPRFSNRESSKTSAFAQDSLLATMQKVLMLRWAKKEVTTKQQGKEHETEDEARTTEKKQSSATILDDTIIDEEETAPKSTIYVSPEDAPYWKLWMNKIAETHPSLCCCLVKKYGFENILQKRLDFIDHEREKSKTAKFFIGFKRFSCYLFSFTCFFFTIVDIGATYQQYAAKNTLQDTFELLYPPDYLNSTMCAWDSPGPNATIETFDSRQDVYDADYEIIHCGACGRCSNWNDITFDEALSGPRFV